MLRHDREQHASTVIARSWKRKRTEVGSRGKDIAATRLEARAREGNLKQENDIPRGVAPFGEDGSDTDWEKQLEHMRGNLFYYARTSPPKALSPSLVKQNASRGAIDVMLPSERNRVRQTSESKHEYHCITFQNKRWGPEPLSKAVARKMRSEGAHV